MAPPEVAAPRTAPPPSEETIREDRIRQWTIWATTPGHHLRELARRNLAALEAEAPAGEGP